MREGRMCEHEVQRRAAPVEEHRVQDVAERARGDEPATASSSCHGFPLTSGSTRASRTATAAASATAGASSAASRIARRSTAAVLTPARR